MFTFGYIVIFAIVTCYQLIRGISPMEALIQGLVWPIVPVVLLFKVIRGEKSPTVDSIKTTIKNLLGKI